MKVGVDLPLHHHIALLCWALDVHALGNFSAEKALGVVVPLIYDRVCAMTTSWLYGVVRCRLHPLSDEGM